MTPLRLSVLPVALPLLAAISLVGCQKGPGSVGDSGSSQEPAPAQSAVVSTPSKKEAPMGLDEQSLSLAKDGRQVAVLAGGCFWGMEELLREVDGVVDTEVGYAGGTTADPSYEDVKTGRSGHAESVRIVFEPAKISYAELLEKWFFRMHDPTTKDRQGNDRGSQYRSAIFAVDEEQASVARDVIKKVNESGIWGAPIVTEVVPAGPFTSAEGYHQDYLQVHPNGYTCHYLRDFNVY